MKRSKKIFALALLVPVLITVACGSGGKQEETAETDTETTETAASEAIGAGTDVNTELDAPDAKASVPLGEALTITTAKMETQPGRNKIYVDIENTAGEDVYIEWLDLAIDGQMISKASGSEFPSWFPDHNSQKIKAGETYQEIFFIDHPDEMYVEYAEMTVESSVSDSDKTQTEPLKVTLSLKDVETVDITDTFDIEKPDTATSKEIYVEEQELYSKDGIVITVTKMEMDKYGGTSLYLELTNNGRPSSMLYYKELYIDDTLLVAGDDIDATMYEEPAYVIYISSKKKDELIREESPEISIVLEYRAEEGGEKFQTPQLTFPVLSK